MYSAEEETEILCCQVTLLACTRTRSRFRARPVYRCSTVQQYSQYVVKIGTNTLMVVSLLLSSSRGYTSTTCITRDRQDFRRISRMVHVHIHGLKATPHMPGSLVHRGITHQPLANVQVLYMVNDIFRTNFLRYLLRFEGRGYVRQLRSVRMVQE